MPNRPVMITRRRAVIALLTMTAVFAGSLVWLQRVSTEAHNAAQQAKVLARRVDHESSVRYAQIQQSRLDVCRDQNARHTVAIRRLKLLIRKAKSVATTEAERRALAQAQRRSLFLINGLAPQRDCVAEILGKKP